MLSEKETGVTALCRTSLGSCRELSLVLSGDLDGWNRGCGVGERSKRKGIYMYILTADSVHCIAKTNTAF